MGQVEACCGGREKPPKPAEAPALLEYNVEEYVSIDSLRDGHAGRHGADRRGSVRGGRGEDGKRRKKSRKDRRSSSLRHGDDGPKDKRRKSRRQRDEDAANGDASREKRRKSRAHRSKRGGSVSEEPAALARPEEEQGEKDASAPASRAHRGARSDDAMPAPAFARPESELDDGASDDVSREKAAPIDESDTESSEADDPVPPTPAPIGDSDFRALLDVEAATAGDWQKLYGSKGGECLVYLREIPGDAPTMLRTRVYYFFREHSPEQVFNFLFDNDARLQWDKSFLEMREVEEMPDGTTVVYSRFQAPAPGTKEQEFVDYRKAVELEDGSFAVAFLPAEHTACPVTPQYTRCRTLFSGNVVRDASTVPAWVRDLMPDGTRTVLMSLGQSEAQSPIPSFVINMLKWSVKKVVVKSSKEWGAEFEKGMRQHL